MQQIWTRALSLYPAMIRRRVAAGYCHCNVDYLVFFVPARSVIWDIYLVPNDRITTTSTRREGYNDLNPYFELLDDMENSFWRKLNLRHKLFLKTRINIVWTLYKFYKFGSLDLKKSAENRPKPKQPTFLNEWFRQNGHRHYDMSDVAFYYFSLLVNVMCQ